MATWTAPKKLDISSAESNIVENSTKELENPEVSALDINRCAPEIGGSKVILQRHESYRRKPDEHGEGLGSLTPESAQKAYDQSKAILDDMLGSLTEEEKKDVYFLVVGSDTKFRQQGQRSMETAGRVLSALNDKIAADGLNPEQVLNNRSQSKGVAPIKKMQAPRFIDDSADYLAFLEETYGGENQAFWKAYEEDTHKDIREQMNAEGPDDMDARFTKYVATLSKYAESFHKDNPGKRLVIWGVSHYDTVSPYIKRHITKTDPNQYLAVDYGAGVSVEIDHAGMATSQFQGKEYKVNVTTG